MHDSTAMRCLTKPSGSGAKRRAAVCKEKAYNDTWKSTGPALAAGRRDVAVDGPASRGRHVWTWRPGMELPVSRCIHSVADHDLCEAPTGGRSRFGPGTFHAEQLPAESSSEVLEGGKGVVSARWGHAPCATPFSCASVWSHAAQNQNVTNVS